MILTILDLENNQPSDYPIELGYVIWDTNKKIALCHRDIVIRDSEDELNPEVAQLTHLTQEQINNGQELVVAIMQMQMDIEQYKASAYIGQWGGGDVDVLKRFSRIHTEWIRKSKIINIKHLFESYMIAKNKSHKAGLIKACKTLQLDFLGVPHNAYCDALNTARVYQYLLEKFE